MRRISLARGHGARGAVFLVMVVKAAAAQDTPADVRAACTTLQSMSEAICACVGERSAATLSAEQRAFYVAAVNGDDAETTRLRSSMGPQALLDLATFIRTSPFECAG